MTTAGRSLTGIRRIAVYRYEEELPVPPAGRDPNAMLPGDTDTTVPQAVAAFARVPAIAAAQFAKLSTRIESIESANLPAASTGARLVFEDTPRFRSRDGRPIRLTYAVVTEGPEGRSDFSNLAILVPLDVPVAPPALTARVAPEGVTLSWTTPSAAATGDNAQPVIVGYNIYRDAVGQEPDIFSTPINTAPVTATTYADVPPYGEHEYRVTAVSSATTPRIESSPSAPARAAYRDLIPPPPSPNVTALLETRVVRLIWEPVEAADLAGYNVYRYEYRTKARLKLTAGGATPNTHFGDESIELGVQYRYEVTSVDKAGNESAAARSKDILVPLTP